MMKKEELSIARRHGHPHLFGKRYIKKRMEAGIDLKRTVSAYDNQSFSIAIRCNSDDKGACVTTSRFYEYGA